MSVDGLKLVPELLQNFSNLVKQVLIARETH